MSELPIMKPYINGQYIDSKSEKFNKKICSPKEMVQI